MPRPTLLALDHVRKDPTTAHMAVTEFGNLGTTATSGTSK